MALQNESLKKQTALKDLALRGKAKNNLINSPSPTEKQLEVLLSSQDPLDRKVALVNIMLREIYTESLFKKIIALNDNRDIFFTKFYSYQCFDFLNKDITKKYQEEFIDMINWESSGVF